MPGGIIIPLEVIANWPVPNYVNPETRGPGLIISSAIISALSLAIVCARMIARFKLRNVGIDDWIIVGIMPLALGMTVLIMVVQAKFGFDHHTWDNPVDVAINSRKFVMAIEASYVVCTGTVKISILLFYRRLVAGTVSQTFVWAVRLAVFSVVAYMCAFTNTLIFGCRPIEAYWNQVDPLWRTAHEGQYKCLTEIGTLYAANITSIVQDFITFLMPLLLFTKLNLPIRQKIILGCIFGIGFFLCIVGIIRIIYTHNLYANTYDVTWDSEPLWIWTVVELHGAIICASAPALKVFFKRYLRSGMSGGGSGSGRTGGRRYHGRCPSSVARAMVRRFAGKLRAGNRGDVSDTMFEADTEKMKRKLQAVEGDMSFGSQTTQTMDEGTMIGGPGSAYWCYPAAEMGLQSITEGSESQRGWMNSGGGKSAGMSSHGMVDSLGSPMLAEWPETGIGYGYSGPGPQENWLGDKV